ncbi:hypothetical protein N7456_002439 [Penicillium angulare]|uniref:Uncharacterized protein n=1 Tax=Penicillium angulare TaxID=116970 RepID=A0A9W9G839_9EURO|nr:hypothetical protein N7456_002439 [Penicillium angulare]
MGFSFEISGYEELRKFLNRYPNATFDQKEYRVRYILQKVMEESVTSMERISISNLNLEDIHVFFGLQQTDSDPELQNVTSIEVPQELRMYLDKDLK